MAHQIKATPRPVTQYEDAFLVVPRLKSTHPRRKSVMLLSRTLKERTSNIQWGGEREYRLIRTIPSRVRVCYPSHLVSLVIGAAIARRLDQRTRIRLLGATADRDGPTFTRESRGPMGGFIQQKA